MLDSDLFASDISQIIYVTGTLLKKARIGGRFARNCDSDVSNPRHTGYIRYPWTNKGCSNVHAPVTSVVYVTGAQVSRWQCPTWSVSGTIKL